MSAMAGATATRRNGKYFARHSTRFLASSTRSARNAPSLVRAQALCAELEQLSNSDERPQRAVVARIEGEWDMLRVRDESLQRRFRSAQSALRDAGMRHERASRRAPYEAWLARYA